MNNNNHECNDDGEPILQMSTGETMLQKDYLALPEDEQRKHNPTMGSVTCSICGSLAFDRDYGKALRGEL